MIIIQVRGTILTCGALCVLLCVAVMPCTAVNAPGTGGVNLTGLDQVILSEMNKTHTEGVVVVVVQNGTTLYARGFGTDKNNTPVTPDTILAIGSTTKMFTGYVVASLVEDGALDPDRSVRTYIPELDPSFDRVTTGMLISHSSGLRDWDVWGLPDKLTEAERRYPAEYMKTFNASWMFTDPGTVMSYSNPGVNIAGFAAARAANRSYRELVRDRIILPVGMQNTSIEDDGCDAIQPCGWIVSTGNDMAAFAVALMDSSSGNTSPTLSRQAIRRMTSHTVPVPSLEGDGRYGYGTELYKIGNVTLVGHRGDPTTGTCSFWTVPEKQFAVIIISNKPSNPFPDTFEWIIEHGLSEPYVPPALLPVNPAQVAQVAGTYTGYAGYPDKIFTRNGTLSISLTYPNWTVGIPGNGTISVYMQLNSTPDGHYMATFPHHSSGNYIGFVNATDGRARFLHMGMRAWERETPPRGGLLTGGTGVADTFSSIRCLLVREPRGG
ncbi:MAG: serine hydrolase domain-containing protein [Methanoregula sp.]